MMCATWDNNKMKSWKQQFNRRANTRAPALLDVTMGKSTGKSGNK